MTIPLLTMRIRPEEQEVTPEVTSHINMWRLICVGLSASNVGHLMADAVSSVMIGCYEYANPSTDS